MPQYALACHVFVCMQGEHVVFLDVRNDRYFALESGKTAGLGELVPGWPVPGGSAPGRRDPAPESLDRGVLSPVLALLLEKGILIASAGEGKAAAPISAEAPRSELAADALDDPPRVGPLIFLRFLRAAIVAGLTLKFRPFEYAVARVSARNARRRARAAPMEVARLHHVVAVFATLRPFFFTSKDACLFDALALSEFLAGYGVFPQWMFGVQARPFAAHCWLQQDGVVLNDTVEHVRRYTPIMVV